jgi:hypothetical protein
LRRKRRRCALPVPGHMVDIYMVLSGETVSLFAGVRSVS